jgi:hypothetical protein
MLTTLMMSPCLQQDGATAHRTSDLVHGLQAMFPGSIGIGFGDIDCPARPPDLSAPGWVL